VVAATETAEAAEVAPAAAARKRFRVASQGQRRGEETVTLTPKLLR